MLASLISWWIARVTELLPSTWTKAGLRVADMIVAEQDQMRGVLIHHGSRHEPLTLGAARRLAARKPVVVRAPAPSVLRTHHVVPTAARRELTQMLRYELGRITPFDAEDLFWRWDGRPKMGDRNRTVVTLTMVPKNAITSAIDTLANAGIRPRFIDTGSDVLLEIDDQPERSAGHAVMRGLTWCCAGLALIALLLPVVLQERALRATNGAIEELQPTIRQVEALRRGIAAEGAGRDILAQEIQRTGDILQVLATVTRILPNDTYLTEFSLHDRQMTLGGRSAAAARLITSLSADPAIGNASFAAPVTRIEGATTDVFSIRADVAP